MANSHYCPKCDGPVDTCLGEDGVIYYNCKPCDYKFSSMVSEEIDALKAQNASLLNNIVDLGEATHSLTIRNHMLKMFVVLLLVLCAAVGLVKVSEALYTDQSESNCRCSYVDGSVLLNVEDKVQK